MEDEGWIAHRTGEQLGGVHYIKASSVSLDVSSSLAFALGISFSFTEHYLRSTVTQRNAHPSIYG